MGSSIRQTAAPAVDTHSVSGSPQSIFIILLDFILEKSTYLMPVRPVSSVTVKSISRGGCTAVSSSIRASMFIMPTALSAPSVVPSA